MSTGTAAAASPKKSGREKLTHFVNNYLIITAIIVLMIYTVIKQPAFFYYSNIVGLIKQFVPLGLVSLGMTLIIIGGYIDLSVAGMFSLLNMIAAGTFNLMGPVSFLATALIGLLCGAANAAILIACGARDDSDALFITFGMSTVFTALGLIMNNGGNIKMKNSTFVRFIGSGTIAKVPFMFFVFLVVLLILHFIMTRTPTGRSIHMAGGNPTAANLVGISSTRVITIIYCVTGLLVGIASYIVCCRVGSSSPVVGKNYETNAIMAVTIGGTSLQGGHGSVMKTVVGVLLVTIMQNSLNMLGIEINMQSVWKGLILVVAIWLDARREV